MKSYFVFILLLLSSTAYSAAGYLKGKVEYVRVHDKTTHTAAWAPPVFWFTLDTSATAGDCGVWNGNVLFTMDTDQAYSMVLGAFMAGKEISVRYDDTIKNHNAAYCSATMVTLGNPPPTY